MEAGPKERPAEEALRRGCVGDFLNRLGLRCCAVRGGFDSMFAMFLERECEWGGLGLGWVCW